MSSEKRPALIDVSVAMVFFNRPEQLKEVFATVKKAAPSKLFLIQDGARQNNPNDAENIKKCREVVKDIDWECDVKTNYSDENLGCGKRIMTGLSWCFEQVDRLIILEDDCVASQSFFPFCKEMLDKYIDDERVYMITGMNHLNTFDKVDTDYLFAKVGSIAGWATWKRFWNNTDFSLSFLEDENSSRLLKNISKNERVNSTKYAGAIVKKKQIDNGEKLSSWSAMTGLSATMNSQMVIVPRVNMMTNIGLTSESTNSPDSINKIPHGLRPLYRLKLYELDFPLKHPKYIAEDYEYEKLVLKLMRPSKPIAFFRKIESGFLRVIHGDLKGVMKSVKRAITKK